MPNQPQWLEGQLTSGSNLRCHGWSCRKVWISLGRFSGTLLHVTEAGFDTCTVTMSDQEKKERLNKAFQAYLGAKNVDVLDAGVYTDYMVVKLHAVYEESTPLYKNQLIRYTLTFVVWVDLVKFFSQSRSEQWDCIANEPVNWSRWWPDKKVNPAFKEQVILACLEVI